MKQWVRKLRKSLHVLFLEVFARTSETRTMQHPHTEILNNADTNAITYPSSEVCTTSEDKGRLTSCFRAKRYLAYTEYPRGG